MKSTFRTVVLSALLATTGFHGLAMAAPTGAVDKDQLVAQALADHPGKVTKVYQEQMRGKTVWEVKIDGDDGKRYEVYFDATSGELVKTEVD